MLLVVEVDDEQTTGHDVLIVLRRWQGEGRGGVGMDQQHERRSVGLRVADGEAEPGPFRRPLPGGGDVWKCSLRPRRGGGGDERQPGQPAQQSLGLVEVFNANTGPSAKLLVGHRLQSGKFLPDGPGVALRQLADQPGEPSVPHRIPPDAVPFELMGVPRRLSQIPASFDGQENDIRLATAMTVPSNGHLVRAIKGFQQRPGPGRQGNTQRHQAKHAASKWPFESLYRISPRG